jgi:hypothetical protein
VPSASVPRLRLCWAPARARRPRLWLRHAGF